MNPERYCHTPNGLVEEYAWNGKPVVYVKNTATSYPYEVCLELLGDGWTAECTGSTIAWAPPDYKQPKASAYFFGLAKDDVPTNEGASVAQFLRALADEVDKDPKSIFRPAILRSAARIALDANRTHHFPEYLKGG